MTRENASIGREATALVILILAVVAVSAWLRLHGAGLGCEEWPACYGRNFSPEDYRPPALARAIHRLVASLALLLTLYLAWRARTLRPRPPWAPPVFALLGLMLGLAAVGGWSHDPRNAAVNFVNLVGGLLLVPISWRVMRNAGTDAHFPHGPRSSLVVAGIAALLATVTLGAWIGASHAAVDVSAAGVALHWLHRGLAVLALLLLGQAAWRRLDARAARALLALLAVELVLGVLLVVGDFPLLIAVAHNLTAALLLAMAWQLPGQPDNPHLSPLADDKRLD